jgi:hypothetical protein
MNFNMKNRYRYLIALAISVSGASMAQANDLAIVASADSDLTAVSRDQAAEIFLQNAQTIIPGTKVFPVFLADRESALTELFARQILGKSIKQLRAYWNLKVLSGRIKPPIMLKTSKELIDYLLTNQNAIGYLYKTDVPSELRVLYREGPSD